MYEISIGELIDRLSIVNIKQWHLGETLAEANEKEDFEEAGRLVEINTAINKDRIRLREEINVRLEGISLKTSAIESSTIGR